MPTNFPLASSRTSNHVVAKQLSAITGKLLGDRIMKTLLTKQTSPHDYFAIHNPMSQLEQMTNQCKSKEQSQNNISSSSSLPPRPVRPAQKTSTRHYRTRMTAQQLQMVREQIDGKDDFERLKRSEVIRRVVKSLEGIPEAPEKEQIGAIFDRMKSKYFAENPDAPRYSKNGH
uniref:Uncharacterized protein n=2 Tax=Caenorhabditis japonica TaxID=281687 RepID=A0A8R1IEA8_CAEJA